LKINDNIFIPQISQKPLRILCTREGGFGRVYIVETDAKKKYALKTLKWEIGLSKQQLREEAFKLARIPSHPHIISIDGIAWINDSPFIILPWCEKSLADAIQHRLDKEAIVRYSREIASGLSFLHDNVHLLHLDLKPANVLIDGGGKCILSDFGLSRCFPRATPKGALRDLFVSGLTGTIAYMSPEHFLTSRLSAKSDVFAFGVMVYEMLNGQHPFLRTTMEDTIHSILRYEPAFPFFGGNRSLQRLCRKCLRKNPEARQTAAEIVVSLQTETEVDFNPSTNFNLAGVINRASAYLAAGKASKAEELLLYGLKHQPWSLLARINLAEVYLVSNQIEKAMSIATEALDLAPWYPDERSHLPTLLTNLSYMFLSKDPNKALTYARSALDLSPEDWQALANAAEACRLLAEGGSTESKQFLEEGFEHIKKGLLLNPNDKVMKITYGNLLLIRGDLATLSPLVVEIINQVGGDDIPARVLLIRTFIATNQLDDADKWVQPMFRFKPLELLSTQLNAEIEKKRRQMTEN
jgi:serine/threonine protein kinase